MYIYDTHAHLDHLPDLEKSLKDAQLAGVRGIVAMSMDLESCRRNLEIKRTTTFPKVYLGMGMHPSEANLIEAEACLKFARENANELTVIGEIGLDFWYKWVRKDEEKKNEQREVFRRFLELAKELHLPVAIHSRGAWRECLETVQQIGVKKAEFHWYSGPIDVLNDIIAAGFYVSASPSVAYSVQSREAIKHAPIERIMIETDSPVYFGDREEGTGFEARPGDVVRTWKAYCELTGFDEAKALEQFNKNAEDFFGLN